MVRARGVEHTHEGAIIKMDHGILNSERKSRRTEGNSTKC